MKTARCYLQALRLTEQELKNGIPGFGGRFLDDHPKLVVILFFRRPFDIFFVDII